MSQYLPYVVAGLAAGSVYGLAGTGLTVTYKTSGILNFAYPAMAAVGAYVFFFLSQDTTYFNVRLPWGFSAAITVLLAGPLMGLLMEFIARGLAAVSTALQVVATIGLSLGVIGALGYFYANNSGTTFNSFLPTSTFSIGGTNVGWDQLTLFLFGIVSVTGLSIYFRITRLGTAMRAVVDNPDLMSLTGTSAASVRRWAWVIGGAFAAASGVLLGPTLNMLSGYGFYVLVFASFGAAAVGLFRSVPLTLVGGLLIGVLGSLSTKWETSFSWLAGVSTALPFIVLFVVLIVVKPSKLADTRVDRPRPMARSYYGPWKVRLGFGIVVVALLALVPTVLPTDVAVWGTALIYAMVILSLGLLVKESGQVSLCQAAFAAVGGVAFAHATTQWGFPFFAALVLAGALAAVVSLVVAIPAIRVAGVFLALATVGFGLALQNLAYPTAIMFTTSYNGLSNLPRPDFASTYNAFYYLILVFAVASALVMVSIRSGRLGRLLRGLADSPLALNTLGTSVNATRVIVFCISAFFAGLAGALYASFFQGFSLGTPLVQPNTSIELFIIVMLVAGASPWYALIGGIGLGALPTYFSNWFPNVNVSTYQSLILGFAAVAVALQADRAPGLPKPLRDLFERLRTTKPFTGQAEPHPRPAGQALEVEEINVRFGGIQAVNSLSLHAPFGRITGLIGPNGAGKTTTFNVCSGLRKPSSGKVHYGSADISALSPARRARLGIGRTFQQAELWDTLTVRENVELGAEAPAAGRRFAAQLVSTRGERSRVRAAAIEAMELTGLTELSEHRAADLSTGQRRLVELTRVLAGPFNLLLLDEPSSGLDKEEGERFGTVLQRVVRDKGIGVLLVEHDMQLVMSMCEYIYVMDFGEKIFEGTPLEVASSEAVRAAYLGSEAAAATPDEAEAANDRDGRNRPTAAAPTTS
jgi:ABC-type branched-subunit amino acid transport system ATPase component/branched-subunit amino acid ABC-type transport system permease component